MSAKVLSLFLIAPTLLVGSVAQAQTSDKSPPESKEVAQAAPPPPPAAEAAPAAQDTASKDAPRPTERSAARTIEPVPGGPALTNPWFVRPPFEVKSGDWKLQIYGFAEGDVMNDSTRSFTDGANNSVLAHDGTQAGTLGRTQTTIRNSRIGLRATAPEFGGVRSLGLVEGDFFGYDPNPATGGTSTPTGAAATPSEAGFFNNPTFRIRAAYLRLYTDNVDFLIGQTYHLLAWQNYFFATSVAFLGLPSELFNRTQMVKLAYTFKSDAVNVDVAVGAVRPVQRDSAVPDGEAGLRLMINQWKGIHTPGNGGTAAFPAAIGVSGMVRRFRVDQFAATPTVGSYSTDTGYAIAVDALIPVIPAVDSTDRGNALTVVGEFATGSGDADEYTGMTAGATNKLAPGATTGPDIDNGLVTYDSAGILHTIPWQTFLVGFDYYLPPTGRVILAANYSQGDSNKMQDLYGSTSKTIFKSAKYVDTTLFWDVTPAARLGLGYQLTMQTFADNTNARNHRFELTGLYFF
jgi:hypothetical protein